MSKQYGLIVPGKDKPKPIIRPSIFDEDSDDDAPARPTGLKRGLKQQDKINQNRALEEDPTVYQYDEVYDEMDKKRKESKLSRKDLDRKPKYINRLLAAADKRKRENERRIERQVQKEREAEGEEFKDKEAFVTNSYKKKLEEMKALEEEEKREEYLESIGDVKKQGNLDGFYRHLYDQKVNYENKNSDDENQDKSIDIKIEPSEAKEDDNKARRAVKRKYRKREDSDKSDADNDKSDENDEIKKEHLPSNLDADSDFSIDSSDSEEENNKTEESNKHVDETKIEEAEKVEEKVVEIKTEDTKEEIIEIKKPKIDIWKKRTVGEVFDAALQRYFERKSLRGW